MKTTSLRLACVSGGLQNFALLGLVALGACSSYESDTWRASDGDDSPGSTNSGAQPPTNTGTQPSANAAPAPESFPNPSSPDTGVAAPVSQAPATNPFVETAHDPFSTFAIDVDTASYDIFRRDVNLGRLPQANQMRVEEFVNAFKYSYPTADLTDESPFAVGMTAAASPFATGTTLLRVHLQGKPMAAFEKKPTNLVYLIDVSGSMASADKLGLVKQVARQSLDVLAATDKVSIVTYSGTTAVRLPPTLVSEATTIRAVIDGLQASGSTAGASGIMLAYEQAQAAFIPGGINHVVMCTDGDFNVGISSSDALVQLIEEKRKTGVTLTALGFGADNLNDAMMERVSNAGDGVYSVISSEQQAANYVRDGLLASIVHIAKDVKIQVEFNPTLVSAYRLLGYENRDIADRDFRNDLVDAGEIGAGHQVTALYELVLQGAAIPAVVGAPAVKKGPAVEGTREIATSDLAMVKVRYKAPAATQTDPAKEIQARLAQAQVLEALAMADADMQWSAAVAAFAEILKRSPFANPSYLEFIESVTKAQATRDEGRTEFAQLFAKARPLLMSQTSR